MNLIYVLLLTITFIGLALMLVAMGYVAYELLIGRATRYRLRSERAKDRRERVEHRLKGRKNGTQNR